MLDITQLPPKSSTNSLSELKQFNFTESYRLHFSFQKLPSAKMDVVSALSGYILKMVSAGDTTLGASSSKMKILLLDSETVRVYGMGNLEKRKLNVVRFP